jgi:Ca2+:H+ antiporter
MPIIAWLLYFLKSQPITSVFAFLLTFSLMGAVVAAVYHAEVIAHRIGEPFGTLLLAIAVTS